MKNHNPPYIIAVSGPSGSGKTTCARILAEKYPKITTIIAQDSYYLDRSDLTMEQRSLINYDHPESIDQNTLALDIAQLKQGKSIEIPTYDYTTHSRLAKRKTISPRKVIIVEGITLLCMANLASLIDTHIFLDVPLDICLLRRIKRDRATRNRTTDQILEQYEKTVRPMYYKFIYDLIPQADHIIASQNKQEQINNFLAALDHYLR